MCVASSEVRPVVDKMTWIPFGGSFLMGFPQVTHPPPVIDLAWMSPVFTMPRWSGPNLDQRLKPFIEPRWFPQTKL